MLLPGWSSPAVATLLYFTIHKAEMGRWRRTSTCPSSPGLRRQVLGGLAIRLADISATWPPAMMTCNTD